MEAYDAAVIGAGAEGLAAATILARAGLRTIVCERNAEPGGRCQTIEFHPGFRASPFCDEAAVIPDELFWSLGLAERGALAAPTCTRTAVWPDRVHTTRVSDSFDSMTRLAQQADDRRKAVLARAVARPSSSSRWAIRSPPRATAWPGEDWAHASLAQVVGDMIADADIAAHAMASSLSGRAADPLLNGSALHLIAPPDGSGLLRGGLGGLARALLQAAREAGATVSCGLDVTDIRHQNGHTKGLSLADGTEIATSSIISTLDLKRTFLSLFRWEQLPAATIQRVNLFRLGAASARLLVALDRLPEGPLTQAALRGPIVIAPDCSALVRAYASWRAGVLPDRLVLTLRFVSAVDPALAPPGQATMTVTVGGVPHRFFDGTWTHAWRDQLRTRVLKAIDDVLPGTSARVLALKLIAPPDIEEAIGRTDGDLSGGDIAPDQMLRFRPWSSDLEPPRTPMRGLYIAGPSTTSGVLALCASGAAAAEAVIAEAKQGWLR